MIKRSVCILLVLYAFPVRSQDFDVRKHYKKSEVMVPMRDGVELFTIIYEPRDASTHYPILLLRTPYSIPPYGPDNYREQLGPSRAFDEDGFIFVFQDVRGKYRSEGDFVVMRAYDPDKKGARDTDESSDNYDTIEWLLANVENHNGRVGQYGVSYPGFQTVMGMIDAHPALVASSPQASPSDMFIGDDWHHNGAFRLMYAFSWLSRNARVRGGQTEERVKPFDYGTPDGYRFFLELGSVANVNERFFHYTVPTWNEFMEHGTYDDYWQRRVLLPHLNNIEHPTLNVAGWFDAEDFYGPMSIYYEIEERNPDNQSLLVVGPWLHGGWNRMPGDALGNVRFDSKTSDYFQEGIHLPFFRHHLKGAPDPELPEAYVFETGANVWKKYDDCRARSSEGFLRGAQATAHLSGKHFERRGREGRVRGARKHVELHAFKRKLCPLVVRQASPLAVHEVGDTAGVGFWLIVQVCMSDRLSNASMRGAHAVQGLAVVGPAQPIPQLAARPTDARRNFSRQAIGEQSAGAGAQRFPSVPQRSVEGRVDPGR